MTSIIGRRRRPGKRALRIAALGFTGLAFAQSSWEPALDQALDTPDLAAARRWRALDFRTDINGLRALAVIGVVAFHADRALLPGGFSGVDVFFVISGFLISRIILSECAVGHFSLAMFYAKRARRILPALLVVAAAVWIVGWFRAAPTQFRDIGGGLLGNSYFTVNFWLLRLAGVGGYFGADSATKPLLHLWSLSIEEQFYLVWSVLVSALHRLAPRVLPFVILAIFVASFGYCVILTPVDPIGAFYLPWTRGWELALGALLAYREVFWLRAWPYPSRALANLGAALGVALILIGYLYLNEAQPFPGWRAAIPTFGCALVIANPRSLGRRRRARQSRRRVLRRRFLSALSLALAVVRLRPHLARRHSDARRDVRPRRRGGRPRRLHLSLHRGAGGGALPSPSLRARARARRRACGDRDRRPRDL